MPCAQPHVLMLAVRRELMGRGADGAGSVAVRREPEAAGTPSGAAAFTTRPAILACRFAFLTALRARRRRRCARFLALGVLARLSSRLARFARARAQPRALRLARLWARAREQSRPVSVPPAATVPKSCVPVQAPSPMAKPMPAVRVLTPWRSSMLLLCPGLLRQRVKNRFGLGGTKNTWAMFSPTDPG